MRVVKIRMLTLVCTAVVARLLPVGCSSLASLATSSSCALPLIAFPAARTGQQIYTALFMAVCRMYFARCTDVSVCGPRPSKHMLVNQGSLGELLLQQRLQPQPSRGAGLQVSSLALRKASPICRS